RGSGVADVSSMSDASAVVGDRRGRRSGPCGGALGEFELADVAVGEREFVAQVGDLFAQPLVLVECGAQPGADRLIAGALSRRRLGRCRLWFAAQPLDLGA